MKRDPRGVEVSGTRRAMLDYVITLTEEPWACTREQIDAMRAEGLTDEAISVVNLVACFFAWCNRVVDGLGVQLEESQWPAEVRAREDEVKRRRP